VDCRALGALRQQYTVASLPLFTSYRMSLTSPVSMNGSIAARAWASMAMTV
jgi:hypothetical protein